MTTDDYSSTQVYLYGCTRDQEQSVHNIKITNKQGTSAEVLTYGAVVKNILLADRNGELKDILFGLDTLEQYEKNPSYMGAVIGPVSGRISNAKITVDGVQHQLPNNFHGHCIHSGPQGFSHVVWTIMKVSRNSVKLEYKTADGEAGFPGPITCSVAYKITEENEFKIIFKAQSVKATPFSPISHLFINLSGEGNGNIHDHQIQLPSAVENLVQGEWGIPTGKRRPVDDELWDLRVPIRIGSRIMKVKDTEADRGFSQFFGLDPKRDAGVPIARVRHPGSGRGYDLHSTEPGLQIYTCNHGNFVNGEPGKNGKLYGLHGALSLQPQQFVDACNIPEFPSNIIGSNKMYKQETVYKFYSDGPLLKCDSKNI